ncbi:MAG TPA: GGDEF domain-containing protein [Candidatus Paceibacterota bacterium]|nr:GGDEF domain-containing protein [Candidatus Paceibacterota bacterium]
MSNELEKLKKQVALLQKLVYKDPLTDLYNRRGFLEASEKIFRMVMSVKNHERKKFRIEEIALVLLDLDDFKKINDKFGHEAGDAVLKGVAEILRNSLREIDVIGRWGGEEIVILLLGAGKAEALKISEDLRVKISQREFILKRAKKIKLTASFGVAGIDGVAPANKRKTLGELIAQADKAMYQAKKKGKNRVVTI